MKHINREASESLRSCYAVTVVGGHTCNTSVSGGGIGSCGADGSRKGRMTGEQQHFNARLSKFVLLSSTTDRGVPFFGHLNFKCVGIFTVVCDLT